jgi:hypothetical protein
VPDREADGESGGERGSECAECSKFTPSDAPHFSGLGTAFQPCDGPDYESCARSAGKPDDGPYHEAALDFAGKSGGETGGESGCDAADEPARNCSEDRA